MDGRERIEKKVSFYPVRCDRGYINEMWQILDKVIHARE